MLLRYLLDPLAAVLLLAVPRLAHAQTGAVGIGTAAPDASAALDIVSTSKGLLLPRVAAASAIASLAAGLLVYQTGSPTGFYYNSGNAANPAWLRLGPADNLGNHTATQNLDMATNQLVGNGGTAGLAVSSTGNVGIGTTSPAARLDVVGNVRIPAASSYTYDGLRAYTLMLGAFDFRPEDGVTPLLYRQGTEEVYPGTASSSIFRAPVHLPQGALVTSITLLSYDNEPSYDIQAQLMEYRTVSFQSYNMSMGRAVTSGTPWYSEVSSDVYGYPVDNNTRAVSVRVIFGVGNTPSLTLRGVRVNYTVSRVD